MKHCLLIESSIGSSELFQEALEAEGYKVTWAYNNVEAMGLMNDGTSFDFVWSSGLYVSMAYEAAIAKYGADKVIIYTGDLETFFNLRKRGVQTFLKPNDHLREIIGFIKVRFPP